jgi:hypothetical protein
MESDTCAAMRLPLCCHQAYRISSTDPHLLLQAAATTEGRAAIMQAPVSIEGSSQVCTALLKPLDMAMVLRSKTSGNRDEEELEEVLVWPENGWVMKPREVRKVLREPCMMAGKLRDILSCMGLVLVRDEDDEEAEGSSGPGAGRVQCRQCNTCAACASKASKEQVTEARYKLYLAMPRLDMTLSMAVEQKGAAIGSYYYVQADNGNGTFTYSLHKQGEIAGVLQHFQAQGLQCQQVSSPGSRKFCLWEYKLLTALGMHKDLTAASWVRARMYV